MGLFSGLGAGIGGLLGLSGGGSRPAGSTTTTTVQDIPEWLKPYVTGNLNAAQGVRDRIAGSGSGIMNLAIPEYERTVRGDYLDPSTNPWLDATYKHAAGLVGSGVDSRFESSGRYGSGAHQGVLQEGFNNLATNIFGGNYQAERARQMAAISGLPAFNLGNETAAMFPYTSFAGLTPNLKTGAETTPYFTNPMGNALSGALAGGVLGGQFGLPDISSLLSSLGLGGGLAGLEGGAGYAGLLGGSAAAVPAGVSLADLLAAGVIAL